MLKTSVVIARHLENCGGDVRVNDVDFIDGNRTGAPHSEGVAEVRARSLDKVALRHVRALIRGPA